MKPGTSITVKDKAQNDDVLPNVGLRLRTERRTRRMRLRDLADAAGCSESLLSRIENGLVVPSLTTLHRLCKALNISVTVLLNRAEDSSFVLYRDGARPQYSSGGWVEGDGSMAENLVPFAEGRQLEAHIMHVPARGKWCGPYKHAGEELGYVLEGELELKVSENSYIIRKGDSFFFPSDQNHSYRASGEIGCRILWVNTPPTF
jgi:transcriptional regulator with XRE-family HTH domain